jgi:hypothetical protein
VIYTNPSPDEAIDQGDLIDRCPLPHIEAVEPNAANSWPVDVDFRRVVVLTQTCDLANEKTTTTTVAEVFDAQVLVDRKVLKPAEIKGPLRAGRIWGWYFLPAQAGLGLGEMIVDLRRLHTVRLVLLIALVRDGKRKGRVPPLYREHLAKHFADTFSRIGLPRPYETL